MTKVTFLVKEQKVSVISTDVNGIMMSYLTYLIACRMSVKVYKICPGRKAQWVKYENIYDSDLDGMSLA